MERLKMMKESLMNCVQSQMGDLKHTNAQELGEAIDMIKDLEEAIYYCTIVEAMKKSDKEKDTMKYTYPPVMYNSGSMRMNDDQIYYDGNSRGGRDHMYYMGGNSANYPTLMDSYTYPREIRDYREGRSPIQRRNYIESKELHHNKEKQMKELEEYMNELTKDIMEMIEDASPEEKTIVSQKINTLADKIR